MKKFIKENKAFSAFSVIALFMLLVGLVAGRGNELVLAIFGEYIILPIAGFIACISMGIKGGKLAFITPVIVTAANILVSLAVFFSFDIIFLILGAVPAAIGCAAGLIIGRIKKIKK